MAALGGTSASTSSGARRASSPSGGAGVSRAPAPRSARAGLRLGEESRPALLVGHVDPRRELREQELGKRLRGGEGGLEGLAAFASDEAVRVVLARQEEEGHQPAVGHTGRLISSARHAALRRRCRRRKRTPRCRPASALRHCTGVVAVPRVATAFSTPCWASATTSMYPPPRAPGWRRGSSAAPGTARRARGPSRRAASRGVEYLVSPPRRSAPAEADHVAARVEDGEHHAVAEAIVAPRGLASAASVSITRPVSLRSAAA